VLEMTKEKKKGKKAKTSRSHFQGALYCNQGCEMRVITHARLMVSSVVFLIGIIPQVQLQKLTYVVSIAW